MGGKSSPPAPDYAAAAQQQGVANRDTAVAQALLNNPNMITPYGTSIYSGPTDASGRATLTQTLDPQQQAIFDASNKAKMSSLGILNEDIPNIRASLMQPFGYGQPIIQGGYMPGTGPSAPMQYTPGFAGNIQGNIPIGPNWLNNVTNAQYQQEAQFLDPQFKQMQSDLTAKLANQGITPGSDAYNREMGNFQRQQQAAYADAQNRAITEGQGAAQAQFGRQLQSGQFANAAQLQQFQQLFNTMQARNAAVGGQAQIASNVTGLANQAQQQGYAQYAQNRTMPINMLNALLSSAQIQNPTFQATQPTAIAPPPIMTGAGMQGQQAAANASANAGKFGSGLGALGQMGAAWLGR